MRKFLISTTALSVAISPMGTMPGIAQVLNEDGSVTGADGTVLCTPTADAACDLDAIIQALTEADVAAQAEAEAAAQAAAEAEAAAVAEAEAAAQAAADAAAAEDAAAEAAAAEAAAQAEADAAAAAQVEAEAAAEAAVQAEADAAAQAEADAAAQAAADAEAAAQAEADAAAQAAAEAEAAAQAEAEAAAQAAADAEAAAQAQAEADAAAQAAADAAAEAAAAAVEPAAEEPAVEEPAVEEPAAEEPAVEEPAVEAPAAEEPAAEEPAAEEPVVEEPAAEEPVVEEPATEEPVVEEPATEEPVVDEPATEEPVVEEPATEEPVVEEPATEEPVAEEPATDETAAETPVDGIIDPATGEVIDAEVAAQALEAAEAELSISASGELVDPAANLKVAEPVDMTEVEPVDAPEVSETEVESLMQLLTADPTAIDPGTLAAAETVAATPVEEGETFAIAPADPADLIGEITESVITEDNTRTSAEEFAAAPVTMSEGKKSGLSDLEKAGLLVLGALAVGAIIKSANDEKEDRRVVSNTGDRVIVLRPDGTYQVLKDDDTVIRQPGSRVRTETFRDGSTRTIVEREDGTKVVTIRDATGRVLRRATYDDRGREIILIDDLQPEEVVIIRDLPRPERRIVISSKDNDAALKRELAALEAEKAGRKFSLRQIREIAEVRALAAVIDVEAVTFASGSAAIAADEASNLADLGRVMQELLDENPDEMFLIEGHTDATGKAALNLALSDRRAESVALALTEYFDIPPENMVVQGYGETELLIDTQASEPENRRVEVRVITPLMRTASLQ
jgi:outer membrane protein OmpA-like peptidoglycan-associated protein